MSAHTKGLLRVKSRHDTRLSMVATIEGPDGWLVSPRIETHDDAARLVACWNYCGDYPTQGLIDATECGGLPELFDGCRKADAELVALRAQRDELLAALQPFVGRLGRMSGSADPRDTVMQTNVTVAEAAAARAAIAKAGAA